MKYRVSDDILNSTSKCRNDFSCLYGETDCLCEFNDAIENKLLFVKPNKNATCNYMLSFGYSYLCNCPTRKEIFHLYKI